MAKMRVHELAAELGVDAKAVLVRLRELGEFVKSPSSSIEDPVARKVRASFVPDPLDPVRLGHRRCDVSTSTRMSIGRDSIRPPIHSTVRLAIGAVAAPQHPDLLANVERVRYKYPVLRDHIDALRSLGSQVVYAGSAVRMASGLRDRPCAIQWSDRGRVWVYPRGDDLLQSA